MLDHEERIAATLRLVTDDMPARPSLAADVRRGAHRRRVRRRVVCGVCAGFVVVALAAGGLRSVGGSAPSEVTGDSASPSPSASVAAKPLACAVARLPLPAGQARSLVTGGDPGGRFLVGRAYGSDGYVEEHPLLIWDGDRLAATVEMPGSDESFADVNGSGVAVGSSFGGDGRQASYIYRDGKLTPLPASGHSVIARGVGADATVVGEVVDNSDGPRRVPVVWRNPAQPATTLPLPAGFEGGAAVDVDTDGTIIGMVFKKAAIFGQGYVWGPDGTGRLLPLPEHEGEPALSVALTSVHHGVAIGSTQVRGSLGGRPATANIPLLVDLRTGAYTLLTHAMGDAVNTMGWIVITANVLEMVAPTGRAVLPALAATGSRASDRAVFASEDGVVIGGQSGDANGLMQAVRWRCTKGV